jgi:oligopeptide/dipeptide ABC transporter ATP-binding protein
MGNLIQVRNLKKHFSLSAGFFPKYITKVLAVDGVDFSISRGKTLGLVGESGCGKTTIGRLLTRVIKSDSGEILFDGQNLLSMPDSKFRNIQKDIQMVFQDPQASLNPRMTIKASVKEPFIVHRIYDNDQIENQIMHLINIVGLSPEHLNRYPRELSGGQQQRVGICKAIALNPKFLILDEPTSSLDVCVQAQILNTLRKIQAEMNLTYLFISHDLSAVHYMSDHVAVMYLGQIVEMASVRQLFENMAHPYTYALFSAFPTFWDEVRRADIILKGDVPNPVNPPNGCRFHPRCNQLRTICRSEMPNLIEVEEKHFVRCHL